MADGSVIIDSKLNTQGVEKGAEEIKKNFKALADAARETADTMQQELSDLGLSDANQVTERAAEVMKENLSDAAETVAETFQDATEKMEESFEDAADSSKKASRKIENEFEDIEDAAEDVGEKIEDAFDGLSGKMGRGLSDLFVFDVTNILTGIADATEAVIDFGEKCLEAASNLQEVQNVVDVAFPEMAEQMNALTQQMEKTAGLSETMAKQFAGTFGIMAESMGFTEQEAYNMSETLTQLAGDVASFYNLSQEEAFTKLQSVFTGETESLKSLGVVMTQDALLDYALEKGIIDNTKSMEQQKEEAIELEKAQINLERAQSAHTQAMEQYEQGSIEAREATLKLQEAELDLATASDKAKASTKGSLDSLSEQEMAALRYEFVLDKLSAAQGDFVRTQNSWANQTRILSMQFDKLKTTAGNGMINALTPLIQLMNEGLMPVLQGAAELFEEAFRPTLLEEYAGAINSSMNTVKESLAEAKETFEETQAEIELNVYLAERYVKKLEELEETGLTTAEAQQEYNFAVERLQELLPDAGIAIDEHTGKVNLNTEAIRDNIEAMKEQAEEIAIQKMTGEYNDAMAESSEIQIKAGYELNKLEEDLAIEIRRVAGELGVTEKEAEAILNDFYNSSGNLSLFGGVDVDTGKYGEIRDAINALTTEYNRAGKEVEKLANEADEFEKYAREQVSAAGGVAGATGDAADAQKRFADETKEATNQLREQEEKLKTLKELYFAGRNSGESHEKVMSYLPQASDIPISAEIFEQLRAEYEETGGIIETVNEDIQDSIDVTISEAADSIQETTDKMIESWEQVETEANNSCTTIQKSINSLEGTTLYVDVVPREKTKLFGFSSNYSNPFSTTPGYDPYQAAAYEMASTSYIPYLAKGAVIPPNAPFTAVLGDQRNGYNLEGPEDMFRGIVREELGALEGINEGTEDLLRQLISLVGGIEIGDTTIGRAANRYNNKWSTIRGV